MKINLDINKLFRKVESQRYGWVIIDQADRDWDSGKPLETNELRRIAKLFAKKSNQALTFTEKSDIMYITIEKQTINKGLHNEN